MKLALKTETLTDSAFTVITLRSTLHSILGKKLPIPTSLIHINKWELILLALFSILVLFRNLSLVVYGFGEPDAARIFNDAIIWHHTGNLPFSEYRARIVPGYLTLVKNLIDYGIPFEELIRLLNYLNAVVGAALIILSHFFYRLFLPVSASFACVLIFSFVPSVFFASIYGYPTLLAYTAFLLSVLLFVRSSITQPTISIPFLALSIICLSIGTILKADIILLTSAYLGLLVGFGRVSSSTILSVIIAILIGILAPIIFKILFLPNTEVQISTAAFIQNWDTQFPLSFSHLFSKVNIEISVRAVGPIFAGLSLLGLIFAAWRPEARRIMWLVLLFSAPVALFWGGRGGNSARHMLGLGLPAVLFIGILFHSLRFQRYAHSSLLIAAGAAVAANNLITSPRFNTVAPSSRLVASALLLREHIAVGMNFGAAIISSNSQKHYLIDSYTQPYSFYNVLKHARSVNRWSGEAKNGALEITLLDGRDIILGWTYANTAEVAKQIAEKKRIDGFVVWSVQYREQ